MISEIQSGLESNLISVIVQKIPVRKRYHFEDSFSADVHISQSITDQLMSKSPQFS
jgi:hypothetical protein